MVADLWHFVLSCLHPKSRKAKGEDTKTCLFSLLRPSRFEAKIRRHDKHNISENVLFRQQYTLMLSSNKDISYASIFRTARDLLLNSRLMNSFVRNMITLTKCHGNYRTRKFNFVFRQMMLNNTKNIKL